MKRALAAASSVSLALLGCAKPEPVLYPNAAYESAGEAGVQRDVDSCSQLAEQHKAGPRRGERVVGRVVEDAAVGGAAGAVGGAIFGNAGRGAAAGAAGGATAGLVRMILRGAREPDPNYQGFMERCLAEKGYDVVGWE